MTKPVIVTRLGKGVALTYEEQDANFTNLQNSTINFTGDAGDTRSMDLNDSTLFTGDHNIKVTVDESTQKITIDNTLSQYSFDPIGFENGTDADISFDDATRTFTIEPVGTSYRYWYQGKQVTVTGSKTVTIPNVSGTYVIYFDDETLSYIQSDSPVWNTQVPVSYITWNATAGQSMYSKELHTISMDWKTKEFLHETMGAQYAEGLAISNYTTTGTGASNADAQFDISNGIIYDQDIAVAITHSNTPTANTWEQDLQGPARVPVIYHSGSNGGWIRDSQRDYAVKNGTSLVTYNLNTAGTWSTPDAANTFHVAYWVCATNLVNTPIISIMGQREDNKLSDAIANNTWASLDLTNFPAEELRPLYRVIFKTASAYTNGAKAFIAQVDDFRFSSIIPQGVVAGSTITNAITEGNSNVTVTDTGSGSVTMTVDGTTKATLNSTSLTFDNIDMYGVDTGQIVKLNSPFIHYQSDQGGTATFPSGASYTIDTEAAASQDLYRQVVWDLKNMDTTCNITIALPNLSAYQIDIVFVNNSSTTKTVNLNYSIAAGAGLKTFYSDGTFISGSGTKTFTLTNSTTNSHITWLQIAKVIDSSRYADPSYTQLVYNKILLNDALSS